MAHEVYGILGVRGAYGVHGIHRAGHVARIVVAGAMIFSCGLQAAANDAKRDVQCAARTVVPDQIRTTSCDLMGAVALGMSYSPSFRRLVERVAALHGIVYLTAKPVWQSEGNRVIDGTLQHRVTVAGSYRLLFVTVTPYSGSRPIPIIAHELQHAIEVLDSNAASEPEVDDLFERIGVHTATRTMETAPALAVEVAVANELRSAPRAVWRQSR